MTTSAARLLVALSLVAGTMTACKDDDGPASSGADTSLATDADGADADNSDAAAAGDDAGGGADDAGGEVDLRAFDPGLFDIHELVEDFSIVDCALADGTASTCHRVVVRNVPAAWGPGCPATIDDVGGVGFYDPDGTPVLYALDRALWERMEADGFDIVDADGNVNVTVPTGPPGGGGGPGGGGPGGGGPGGGGPGGVGSSCLDAELVEDLEITWLIPAEPRLAATSTAIQIPDMEYSGLSLDGLPFAPPPPATVMGAAAALPALDPCGGHPQPDGPFHWHLTPHEVNHVLDAAGIREDLRCSAIEQASDRVIGYAADGFPILGSQETDGVAATNLDACRGHDLGAGYHYHVSSTDAPNNLTCLQGVPASGFVSYR